MGKIIVFDTETATAGALIWNFAAMEINLDTGERKLLANIVSANYFNHAAMSGAMFAPNDTKRLIVENADHVDIQTFLNTIKAIIHEANASGCTMAAYNISFDIRAIASTADFYGYKMPTIDHTFCLYKAFVAAVPLEYFLWTLATKRLTAKGNPKMNAESAYAFITKTDFVESHTALEDVQAEIEIMLWLEKRKNATTDNTTIWRWYKTVLTENATSEAGE